MRLYRLGKLGGFEALEPLEETTPQPGPREVLVRMRACSLNHRDLRVPNRMKPTHGFHSVRHSNIVGGKHFGKVVIKIA